MPPAKTAIRFLLHSLANDWLHVLSDDKVQLDFKRPSSDGTKSVMLAPLALIARRHPRRAVGTPAMAKTGSTEIGPDGDQNPAP